MRGLGLNQIRVRNKNYMEIWNCIESLNSQQFGRYATVNDIHRITGISKEIIRHHTNQNVINGDMFEIEVGYNAKGFCIYDYYQALKKDKELTRIFLANTQNHIYELKYPKPSGKNKPVKSSRDYGGLTEREEKKKNKIKK